MYSILKRRGITTYAMYWLVVLILLANLQSKALGEQGHEQVMKQGGITWRELNLSTPDGQYVLEMNGTIFTYEAKKDFLSKWNLLKVGRQLPNELTKLIEDIGRKQEEIAVEGEQSTSNRFVILPTDMADLVKFVRIPKDDFLDDTCSQIPIQFESGMGFQAVKVKGQEGLMFANTTRDGKTVVYITIVGTFSPESTNIPLTLKFQWLKEDGTAGSEARQINAVMQGVLRFDEHSWVPFYGGLECKGGQIKLNANGITFVAETHVIIPPEKMKRAK